jgi:predicted nucleic acid-binding protein
MYLDSNVVIRLVEGLPSTRSPLEQRLSHFLVKPQSLMTSRLTRLECRSKPLRLGAIQILAAFDQFFNGIELQIVELTASIVEYATELRAVYNLKSPDALHLSSAIQSGSAIFLTADQGLARCREITVEIL